MKRSHVNRRFAVTISLFVLTAFAAPGLAYGQVTAVQESISVSTASPLTEAILNGSEVTVVLAGRTFERSIFDIRRAVSVSGIAGVSVGTFGISRASDTKLTIELDFNGDFDEDGTLTFTVGSGAVASYNGAALTDEVTVTALEESVEASTASPLTEATLDGSVVTLTLSGRAYESSIFDVRDGVSVSGIAGVSVGTFGVRRVSDTKVTVELDFNGDIDSDGTLTFTVGSDAIESYNGAALTAELSVSAGMESVTATTTSPLTEATLNGSVVTLTLTGGAYESSIFDVRDGVSVSGITGVSVGTFGIQRKSDTVVTVELTFNGDIDADGTLTFTVGAGAIANYSGAALTAELSVSAGMESVTATTTSPLTEATLNGSVVTLTLTGGAYESSIFDVRDGVSVSGITGVSVGTFGIQRKSDTVVTVELTFNGDIDADGTLTFTVGAGAIANYNGAALTAQLPVSAGMESVTATTTSPLTEATLNGSVVTLTLSDGAYESSIFDVRDGVSVSGITGVSVGTFGIQRKSDTVVTIELTFNGDFDADGTLTFTIGSDAIANYTGAALTAQVSVTALEETVVASTTRSLTEATLNSSVVTLTLTGRSYASSIFDVRGGVTVSGITGVSVGTFGIQRVSDTKVTVELRFNGNIDADGTLTFTVGADAIASYSGVALTAQLPVSAGMESVAASTTSPLTEATLNGSVVTLTLSGGTYASSIFDVRRGVSVSGITGVTVGTFGVQRVNDTKVTVTLTFNGDFDADGTLTFTVGAGAIANYNGAALTAQLPVTAETVAANRIPTFSEGASATRSFAENTGAGQNIGSPVSAADRDGGTLSYSLEGTDAASFDLVATSGQLQTRSGVTYDYEVKNRYEVTVRVSDGQGGSTTIDVTIDLTDVSEREANPLLYWTDFGATDRIQRADLDGANVETVVRRGLGTPFGLAVDVSAGKMYWTDDGTNKIRRADLDGSNAEDVITSGLHTPVWIAVDASGGKLYWTDWGTDRIQRADLDGSNVENLVTQGLNSPAGLALDVSGGKLYWTDSSEDKIQRANLDGSNVENLVTRVSGDLGSPSGLALDVPGGKMYWTDRETGEIRRADLDGSNIEDVITRGLDKPIEVDLDLGAGKMYWTDLDRDRIQRADLDGSNVENLVTRSDGLDDPFGLALAVESAPVAQGPCATGSAVSNPSANPWLVADCNALLEARDPLRGTGTLNWSENTSISSWDGVTITGTPQRVTNLRLWNESLNGTIPAGLSRLTGLKALYLAYNQLTGTIPEELGAMTGLTHLGLMNNQLTGQIPAELRNLFNLRQFALQNNQLTGTIPAWLGSLSQLRILNLHGNRLTGSIPTELGNLTELWQLFLFGNQLTGSIPSQLGNLSLMQEMRLDQNRLTGSIPMELAVLTRLSLLYLAGNSLTGCVPVVLRDVSGNDLDKLSLSDCTGSQGQVTADFNGDGIVNFADFFDFVDAFGTTDAQYDLDGNGIVNFADFFEFVDAFGTSG